MLAHKIKWGLKIVLESPLEWCHIGNPHPRQPVFPPVLEEVAVSSVEDQLKLLVFRGYFVGKNT